MIFLRLVPIPFPETKCLQFWCLYITWRWWERSVTFKNNANSIPNPLPVWEPAEGSCDSFPCGYATWFNASSTFCLLSLSEQPARKAEAVTTCWWKKPNNKGWGRPSAYEVSRWSVGRQGQGPLPSQWKYFYINLVFFLFYADVLCLETLRNSFWNI